MRASRDSLQAAALVWIVVAVVLVGGYFALTFIGWALSNLGLYNLLWGIPLVVYLTAVVFEMDKKARDRYGPYGWG